MCAVATSSKPVLSIVAASRNDDHGGDPLVRTQLFINGISFLAAKYQRAVELILIDWNPVPGRPGLAGVLQLPASDTHCTGRVITVPAELHRRYKYSDVLGFFQMIAKNVGIRRARGEFVLATNIDILFSEELFEFMTGSGLQTDRHYRVDRHDIAPNLPLESTLEQMLQHAWAKPIRTHRRFSPSEVVGFLYPKKVEAWKRCDIEPESCPLPPHLRFLRQPAGWSLEVEKNAPASDLHTNGCGDFALMSRDAWAQVRGYPEFEAFSFNIDSIGLMQAHFGGIREISLLPPYAAFHIEHSIGSGWTPEGEQKLFQRLDQNRILNPEWKVLNALVEKFRASEELIQLNAEHWGLADFDLPEEPLLRGACYASPAHPRAQVSWPSTPVGAILPEFDLDRITVWEERRLAQRRGDSQANVSTEPLHVVQVFWPDKRGDYSEDRSFSARDTLSHIRRFHFFVPITRSGAVLRVDPTFQPGIVEITEIEVSCPDSGSCLWSTQQHGFADVRLGGTARVLPRRDAQSLLRIIATGDDPQIFLPPLPDTAKSAVLLSFSLEFSRAHGVITAK